MRRGPTAPVRIARRGQGIPRRALPDGALRNAATLAAAVGILLAGFLAATSMERLLPSGKDVLAVSNSRNQLDEKWLQSGSSGSALGVFPYDAKEEAALAAPDKAAITPAVRGIQTVMNLSMLITDQWGSGVSGRHMKRMWAAWYDQTDGDISQYLVLGDILDKIGSNRSLAMTTPPPSEQSGSQAYGIARQGDKGYGDNDGSTLIPGYTASTATAASGTSLRDGQYVGVLRGAMPGLSFPDRWLLYRMPVAWYEDAQKENAARVFVADAVYHPSRGLVHFFLHEPQQSFPSDFVQAGNGASVQFVKAQSASLLETLLKWTSQDSGKKIQDAKLEAVWQTQGNTNTADLQGLTDAQADACYIAENLFAVSFPCEEGGRILVYLDAATMDLRGFSRVYPQNQTP